MARRDVRFDFGEHFARLIRECEGEFRFSGVAETGLRQWQTPFRQSLNRVLGVVNMERDLAGFVPDAELLDSVDMGSSGCERQANRHMTEGSRAALHAMVIKESEATPRGLAAPPSVRPAPPGARRRRRLRSVAGWKQT